MNDPGFEARRAAAATRASEARAAEAAIAAAEAAAGMAEEEADEAELLRAANLQVGGRGPGFGGRASRGGARGEGLAQGRVAAPHSP
jgi:hypothetical protein